MVNRVWAYHFGQGIAGNPNNFGATGDKPTHPLLLDWLTSEFIKSGWSIKQLHKLILTSEAYQRSSTHPDLDTLNELDSNRQFSIGIPCTPIDGPKNYEIRRYKSVRNWHELGGLPTST